MVARHTTNVSDEKASEPIARKTPLPEAGDESLLERLGCWWDVAEDVGYVLKLTRFSALVLAIGGLVILAAAQGRALLVVAGESGWSWLLLHVGVWSWALSSWYWARQILSLTERRMRGTKCRRPVFVPREVRVEFLEEHLPRFYGFAAFVIVGTALRFDGLHGWGALLWFVAQGAVFYLFALYRRWASNKAASWTGARPWADRKPARSAIKALTLSERPERGISRDDPRLVIVKCNFLFWSGIWLLLCVVGSISPVSTGSLGSFFIIFFALALWVPIGTFLVLWSRQGDFPILTAILIWALVISIWNDNHEVRTISEATEDERPTLETAFKIWRTANGDQPHLIMVATAGGGSRAAYWTGTVLGALQDIDLDFHRKVFGISGVSGGAVGATVYSALLAHHQKLAEQGQKNQQPQKIELRCVSGDGRTVTGFFGCAQAVTGRDFLSSVLVGMLFPDALQRVWPLPNPIALPDRARALERSWEAAWCRTTRECRDGGQLARSFFEFWPSDSGKWLPALFLNGTSVLTGKRIVTSNLKLTDTIVEGFDFFHEWPRTVRASTAANNASRFPYVEPAGTLSSNRADRVVDGGYFENFGAATTVDILRRLKQFSSDPASFRPIVIQISSDPEYDGIDPHELLGSNSGIPEACMGANEKRKRRQDFASEVWSPLGALFKTQSARGQLAAGSLLSWINDLDERSAENVYFCFRLYDPDVEIPLGWLLPERAQKEISCQLLRKENKAQFTRLVTTISGDQTEKAVENFLKNLYAKLAIDCEKIN